MEQTPAKVLMLEDSDLDADLIRERLRPCIPALDIERVSDRPGYEHAVASRTYELILSDYQVPGFDGLDALTFAKTHQPDVPFIFVSGVMGEDAAVSAMQQGATDYLVKQRMGRLIPAVQRALDDVNIRAERRRKESQLNLALAAGRMGTWTLDLSSFTLDASETCRQNYGRKPNEPFGYEDLAASVLDEDRPKWRNAVDAAIATGGELDIEYRVRWPDDSLHWVLVRASCIHENGNVTAMTGISADVTERRQAESERERLIGELERREDELRIVTDAVPALIAYIDRNEVFRFANRQYTLWFGLPHIRVVGRPLREVIGDGAYALAAPFVAAALAGDPQEFEILAPYSSGSRQVQVRYVPRRDRGQITGFFALVTDLTVVKRAEERARFLANVSAALASLTDSVSTLQKIAGLTVPTFADWCAVDMIDDAGERQRVAVMHADPNKLRAFRKLIEKYPPRTFDPHSIPHVLRTGQPDLLEEIRDTMLVATAHDEDHLVELRAMGLRSHILVPIRTQSRILGVLTFITAESGRRYTPEDLLTAQDIADRLAVAIQNADLMEELKEADRRKNEFLATLAHELRNPLAPIRSGLELLRLAPGDAAMSENIRGRMERQTVQLVRLVDDLMDVSRISRGRLELKIARVDLATVVASAVEASQPLIEKMGHTLTVELPPEKVELDADAVRLSQVFMNLLTNAAKYSEPGGRVWLKARRVKTVVEVVVKDGGIGIPADKLNTIFELFSQVDRTLERSQGGLGIGLSLVRRLVDMHGGTVYARSDGVGHGSEFVVRLPIAVGQARTTHTGAPPKVTKLRILVVDDNRDGADTLAQMLGILGHETHTAYDGIEGVSAVEMFAPDVVLFDIGLPKLNGHDACRRIRLQPWGKKPIMIALTGWGQEEDVRRSVDAGFDHHMVKPVDPEALMTLLAETRTRASETQ